MTVRSGGSTLAPTSHLWVVARAPPCRLSANPGALTADYASASPDDFAGHGSEFHQGNYDAGHYHTRVEWTKYKWKGDPSLLQISTNDWTYSTVTAGSGEFPEGGLFTVGAAASCGGHYHIKGEAVIDLRGTPFRLDVGGAGIEDYQ